MVTIETIQEIRPKLTGEFGFIEFAPHTPAMIEAYRWGSELHAGQKRMSGEPYFETHCAWVASFLDRLVGKGALKVVEDGKRRFVPAVSREACVHSESRSFMDRVFGGEPAAMLLHVIKESKLTPAEINQLKKMLTEKEK